eukprot:CAMPEP_0172498262 /NCGR_PEP_ID=MMETSP1066-20121228/111382_1 /TAXON_ID=671091 /ORGANISM="Coscinodiscus wailesii, Strain CCMP2513" /LENGTH=289 /DNA_ID=CAMNT_0013271479 /DNA_START=127 /DNA_END=996 /DNA_ORIENTATION=-
MAPKMKRRIGIGPVAMRVYLLLSVPVIASFSSPMAFNRFSAKCPADPSCIPLFSPSLVPEMSSDETWVAVYRSNNNQPSVILRDEFLTSMNIATSNALASETSPQISPLIETSSSETPVAVARLRRLDESEQAPCWILDSMRCSLKKEEQDPDCDGGSEHSEAIAVCIDELLLHYLKRRNDGFSGAVKCKATLVAAPLLEDRGFEPVGELCSEMTTHVANLENSLVKYAERVADVGSASMGPRARGRALEILGLLGQLDVKEERRRIEDEIPDDQDSADDDPWASANIY